jgi:pimeloyl-ACP methyl ester carboxylesterase
MTEHILTTPAGTLAYHRLGEGPPRIALVPGWGLNVPFLRTTATWALWESWAAQHPLLVLDRRGTGASRANSDDVSPEQIAADLVAALEDAGVPTVTVWAHGDAALAALPLAAQQPARVERLVLQSPFARLLAAPDMPHGLSLEAMLGLAMLDPAAPVINELDRLGVASETEGDSITRLRATLAAGLFPRLLNEITAADARPLLPAVRAPTLVLHGADDRVIPPAASTALARSMPAARVEIIEGMGHLPSPAHLREVLARVEVFLRDG